MPLLTADYRCGSVTTDPMRFGSVTITNPMGMRQCDKTMGCGGVTTTDLIDVAVLPLLT